MEPFTEDAVALLKEVYASPGLQKKGLKLNEAQERVFHQVMSNTDQVQSVNGFAGTGKTTELEAMKVGWEAEGYTIRGFGTTGKIPASLAKRRSRLRRWRAISRRATRRTRRVET